MTDVLIDMFIYAAKTKEQTGDDICLAFRKHLLAPCNSFYIQRFCACFGQDFDSFVHHEAGLLGGFLISFSFYCLCSKL